jgi:glycylpeptide N-tetradecanoyltransferase
LPRENIIYTYVLEDENKNITDMISFYELPSSILKHEKYDKMRAAYSYYNVATTVPMQKLMNDALIIASNLGFDVFNCLDLMDNSEMLKELHFGVGDGHLRYYLYNWKVPGALLPKDIGMILV